MKDRSGSRDGKTVTAASSFRLEKGHSYFLLVCHLSRGKTVTYHKETYSAEVNNTNKERMETEKSHLKLKRSSGFNLEGRNLEEEVGHFKMLSMD